MKAFHVLFFLFMCLIFSCSNGITDTHTQVGEGNWLTIVNFTAHTGRCGSGVKARFVLNTRAETREMVMEPDTWQHIKIKIEDQETLSVTVYDEETGHLLVSADNVYTYREPNTAVTITFPHPQVRLCPKDFIEWRSF